MGKEKKNINLNKKLKEKDIKIKTLESNLERMHGEKGRIYSKCESRGIIAAIGVTFAIFFFFVFLGAFDNYDLDDAVAPLICMNNGLTFSHVSTKLSFGTDALTTNSGSMGYLREESRVLDIFCKTKDGEIVEITDMRKYEEITENVKRLGTSICDQKFNKTFDAFTNGTLSCKNKAIESYETYDGIKIKI